LAYSIAKLERDGDKASPSFKPLLIGRASDKYMPVYTIRCNGAVGNLNGVKPM